MRGRDAPAFVVAEYASIDMRHPLLDAPATVREILRNYTLLDGQTRPGRLLLRRTAPRFPETLRVGPIAKGRTGEWVDVPSTKRLLFAELDMYLTTRGRISEAVFRVPPVSIEVVYGDGRHETYRFVPATARNGMLMNYLPSSLDDLAGLFLGSARERVVKFRVGGSGALLYEPEFDVVWKEADYTVNADPLSRRQPRSDSQSRRLASA